MDSSNRDNIYLKARRIKRVYPSHSTGRSNSRRAILRRLFLDDLIYLDFILLMMACFLVVLFIGF